MWPARYAGTIVAKERNAGDRRRRGKDGRIRRADFIQPTRDVRGDVADYSGSRELKRLMRTK